MTGLEVTDVGGGLTYNMFALREQARGILDGFGVEYDIVSAKVAKTEFCRTGVVTFNFGTAAAFTRTYDAVIHLTGSTMSATTFNQGYRPDSLFSSTKAPVVPQLFWTWSYTWSGTSTSCAGCSLAVDRGGSAGYNSNSSWQGVTIYDAGMKYKARATNLDGYALTYVFPGTVRNLVGQKTNASHQQEVRPTDGAPCMDCDSLTSANTPGDTTVTYSVLHNRTDITPKAIVVCTFGHNNYDQASLGIGISGVAALDSLTGGQVINKPLNIGFYLAGGFRRGARDAWGGISPDDSSNFKASLDSLATLGVPITVGVNLATDTLSTYAGDFAWYRRLGGWASYAPENWQAIADSAKGGGNASLTEPRDPLGLYRKRAQFGDSLAHAIAGSDTSTASLMFRSLRILTENGLKVDPVVAGPLFDHRPITASAAGDSVFFGLSKAGIRAVVVDANNANSYGARANPRAYYVRSGPNPVGSSAPNRMMVLAAVTMSQDSSAARWTNGMSTDGYSFVNQWGASVEAFWCSAFESQQTRAIFDSGFNGRVIGNLRSNNKARVFVVAASDLGSGVRSDNATRPTRPGWWAVKSIVNTARIANSLAGRSIVVFSQLKNIEP